MNAKLFRMLLIVLVLSLLPFSFLACARDYDPMYEITKDGITYRLEGDGNVPKRIRLTENGNTLRTLEIDPDASVGNADGCYGFYVEDADFDGDNDLLIAVSKEGELLTYEVYLYLGQNEGFVLSRELSALQNISVDAKRKAVFGFSRTKTKAGGDHYELCDKATKYVFSGGVLRPDVYAAVTYYSAQDLYCYSTATYDTEDKSFNPSRDRWLTPAEYETVDFGFLYYFREE